MQPEWLRLYWPVRPIHINQKFGDNIPCVRNFGLPNQDIVSGINNFVCPPGYDKLYGHWNMGGHNGCDLQAGEQNVYAACDGEVIEKQTVPARGLGVSILTNETKDLGNCGIHYAKVRYWHLKTIYVEAGDRVKAGQLLGVTNNTGYSSGNHLHFEVQPMDKDAGGHPFLVNPLGSIAGAIDPEQFFVNIYADTVPQQILLSEKLILILRKMVDLLSKNKE